MWIDVAIFTSFVVGALAGGVQHITQFDKVASDLSPRAFKTASELDPAAKFWGGDFLGAVFLSQGIMALLYCRSSAVREAYMLQMSAMFGGLALTWLRKGESVGSTAINFVVPFDIGLCVLALVGVAISRWDHGMKQKKSKTL